MANELKVFNSDVIPVYETDTGEKVVLGRENYMKNSDSKQGITIGSII